MQIFSIRYGTELLRGKNRRELIAVNSSGHGFRFTQRDALECKLEGFAGRSGETGEQQEMQMLEKRRMQLCQWGSVSACFGSVPVDLKDGAELQETEGKRTWKRIDLPGP